MHITYPIQRAQPPWVTCTSDSCSWVASGWLSTINQAAQASNVAERGMGKWLPAVSLGSPQHPRSPSTRVSEGD